MIFKNGKNLLPKKKGVSQSEETAIKIAVFKLTE